MKLNSTFRSLLVLVVLIASGVGAMAQQVPALPIDPAVRIGKLDNGLTYYIRQNKLPEGRAHFYIAQKVGSMQEEDSQSGLAHFLEHIAFNGTKNFPGKSMINWLETIGVAFGRNLNAYTSFDRTVYTIMDAPVERKSTVDSCLLILHDWSNAISLEDKEIDAERGVIQEEWRQRNTGNTRVQNKMISEAFPGNKYGDRLPIGKMEIVKNFPYQVLRDYYKKWYRPDLQGLIIVGDIDVDYVESTLKKMFTDVPKPVNPAERVYYPVEDHKGVLPIVVTDPEAVGTQIRIEFKSDKAPKEVRASQFGVLQSYLETLFTQVMSERFADITKKANAPFIQALAMFGDYQFIAQTKSSLKFIAIAADGKYKPALEALTSELERVRQHGFTKGEIDRAKKQILSSMKDLYNERDKQKNSYYADQYVEHFLEGGYIPGIETEYQIYQLISDQLTPEVINQAIKQAFTEDNVLVAVTGPVKDGIVYPTKESLSAEFLAARKIPVSAPKEEVSNEKLMDTKPKAGKVIKEDKNGKFGSTVWTLSNGVKVIVKPTTFKDDEIRVVGTRAGGLLLFDKKDDLYRRVVNSVSSLGGLGKFDDNALSKALAGRVASASTSIDNLTDKVSGSSNKEDLETMLQLIYLNFTAKRSDKEAYEGWKEKSIQSIKMREANPMSSIGDTIARALYPNETSVRTLKAEEYEAINYDRAMQLFRQRFADANGFQFTFVGNIDMAKLRPLVETYLGSLPATKKVSKARKDLLPKPRTGEFVNHFRKKLQTPMGFVFNVWSGKLPVNQRNRMAMDILSSVMDQVYVETIREQEGGTYGASTSGSVSYEPEGEAMFRVVYQTDPAKATRMNEVVHRELNKVIAEGVAQDKFNKVVANLEKEHTENLKENGYWLSLLDTYYFHGRDGHTDYLKTLKSIMPKELNTLLKQLFDQKNYIEIMLLPEEEAKK